MDYHREYYKDVFESFLKENDIYPIYGCDLEPNIKGILSSNIRNGIEKSHIYFAFITPSWSIRSRHKPVWPKKEWEYWQEIKKNTYSYDCCFGFYLKPSIHGTKRIRPFLDLPPYISELMSYSISEVMDKHHNTIFAKSGTYDLYINDIDKRTVISKIREYRSVILTQENN